MSMTLAGAADVFAPVRLHARERISEPYEIEVTAVYTGAAKPPGDVLQKPAVVTLRWQDAERHFAGIVREYTPLPAGYRGYPACLMRIVPKLWGLSLAHDCRIFQEKTAQQIIETLLDEGQVTERAFRLTGENPPLSYRTQYNETRLHFATRLMEEAGWYYFFEHAAGGEKLVVVDANASLVSLGARPTYDGAIAGVLPGQGVALGLEKTADYDPVSPTTEVKGEQATVLKTTGALSPDGFLWPAGTAVPAEAATRARLRMEAAEAVSSVMNGHGEWVALTPGHVFEIPADDPFLPPGKYAVRGVVHEAVDETWLAGGAGESYSNSFEVFPESRNWRQPLETLRPRMNALQAAVVLGADGEGDIYTDDLARVKVRFFWDHRVDTKADQAVWARVVQPWAGKGWGGQFIPRVGTEVAVAFMDGDPDRPVVLGGLYNGVDTPIYPKAEKTKSGFRSRSADKGGTADFNEFTFDDKKGNELVYLHAQKDYSTHVEHDLTLKVDNCRIVTVKVDETVTIKGKQTVTITKDQTLKVEEGNRTLTVMKGNYAQAVDTGDYKMTVKTGNYDEAVDTGNYKMAVKTGNWDLGVKTGNVKVKADAGAITIEAAQSITLKVGGSEVKIGPDGISIKGPMLKLKADAMAELASPMTTVKGDGMLTLKGGIVMIN
jgi:type VI secretion system secreted protein VgrG